MCDAVQLCGAALSLTCRPFRCAWKDIFAAQEQLAPSVELSHGIPGGLNERPSLSLSISRRASSMQSFAKFEFVACQCLPGNLELEVMSRAPLFGTVLSLDRPLSIFVQAFFIFFLFVVLKRTDPKNQKSGSDTRLGYVSVPLDDIISPAISLAF